MKRKEYYDTVATLERFISVFDKEAKSSNRKFIMNSFLHAFCDVPLTPPSPFALFIRGVLDLDSEPPSKQKTIDEVKNTIINDYQYIGKRQQRTVFANALFESDLKFGITPLDIPETLLEKIKENKEQYMSGQEIVVEVFRYWREQMKKYKQQEIFDDRVVAKPAASKYVYDRGTDPGGYDPDEYYDSNFAREESVEFDDSASNWAYKERHDD